MARRGCIQDTTANDDDDDDDDDNKDDKDIPKDLLLNPHKLQPPFDTLKVYGDILVLKVAEVEDPLDNNNNNDNNNTNQAAAPQMTVTSNDDFFLDYTKESYLKFAARTDVVPPEVPQEDEEDEDAVSEGHDDEEGEGEWSGQEDDDDEEEEDEEEAQHAMMNLILMSVLRKFEEENGRKPSPEELLALQSAVQQKMGMVLPGVAEGDNEEDGDDNEEEGTNDNDNETEEKESETAASPTTAKTTDDSTPNSNKKRTVEDAVVSPDGEEAPKTKKVKLDTTKDTVAPAVETVIAQ